MSNMVYYRKYRPQTIEDLDSKTVRETLTAALSSKNIHAFLFTGPKGLGKTSAARIAAKIVNCERVKKDIEPCNRCSQCTSITNGTNLDVFEIDGASNRGIDEIRDLRDKIRLLPASASKKVYIIDEVHMLTTEAFNALLKTLEEPPAHALFILCTTEPHKVPATIISRCFHVQFKKATADELVRSFKRIAKGEKLSVDENALLEIAKLSDGSFRDGAKTLEELSLLAGGAAITKELLEQKFKVISMGLSTVEMIGFLKEKDAKSSLLLIDKLSQNGVDIKYFIEQLIHLLHKGLLSEIGVETEDAKLPLAIEEIKKLVLLLSEAHSQIKYAVIPSLPLEIAILEYTQNSLPRRQAGVNKNSLKQDAVSSTPDVWKQLIDKIKVHNQSIAGVLRGCLLESFDDKTLTIATKYKFHKEKLEEKKAQEILEQAIEEITGNSVKVSVVLKKGGE